MVDINSLYFFYYYVSKIDSDFEVFSEETMRIQKEIDDFKKGKNQQNFITLLINKLKNEKRVLSNKIFVCVPCGSKDKFQIRYEKFSEKICEATGLINGNEHLDELTANTNEKMNFFYKKELIVFTDMVCTGKSVGDFLKQLRKVSADVTSLIALSVMYEKLKNGFNPKHPCNDNYIRESFDNFGEESIVKDYDFDNDYTINDEFNLFSESEEDDDLITTLTEKHYKQNSNNHIGLEITFGKINKKDLEWIVLRDTNKYILIITKYAIKRMAYNEELKYITWKDCTLRQWLNNEFYKNTFNNDEKARIQKMRIPAEILKGQSFEPSTETSDYISILSIKEYEQLFGKELHWKCKTYLPERIPVQCWLRNNGLNERRAAFIGRSGSVHGGGSFVNSPRNGVRPIMWISK